jgi:phospholipase C
MLLNPLDPSQGMLPRYGIVEAGSVCQVFIQYFIDGQAKLEFINTGTAGANFLLYTTEGAAPRTYTVEAGKQLSDRLPLTAEHGDDFIVYGPNGFLRRFAGTALAKDGKRRRSLPDVVERYDTVHGNLQLRLANRGSKGCEFIVVNAYDAGSTIKRHMQGGGNASIYFDLRSAYGWYDLSVTTSAHPHFQRRLAGHVETGRSSMSDPALGGGAAVEAPPVRQMYSKLAG